MFRSSDRTTSPDLTIEMDWREGISALSPILLELTLMNFRKTAIVVALCSVLGLALLGCQPEVKVENTTNSAPAKMVMVPSQKDSNPHITDSGPTSVKPK